MAVKSFLKQVLAILAALTIFTVGGCLFVGMRVRNAVESAREKHEAEAKAEEERRIQWNLDFAKEQERLAEEYNQKVNARAKKQAEN